VRAVALSGPRSPGRPELTSDKEKISYSIGMDIGEPEAGIRRVDRTYWRRVEGQLRRGEDAPHEDEARKTIADFQQALRAKQRRR